MKLSSDFETALTADCSHPEISIISPLPRLEIAWTTETILILRTFVLEHP